MIALHYLGDLTYPELAAFLGISVAAAKKRAFTARRRLEEMLPMATDALVSGPPVAFGSVPRHDPALRRDP